MRSLDAICAKLKGKKNSTDEVPQSKVSHGEDEKQIEDQSDDTAIALKFRTEVKSPLIGNFHQESESEEVSNPDLDSVYIKSSTGSGPKGFATTNGGTGTDNAAEHGSSHRRKNFKPKLVKTSSSESDNTGQNKLVIAETDAGDGDGNSKVPRNGSDRISIPFSNQSSSSNNSTQPSDQQNDNDDQDETGSLKEFSIMGNNFFPALNDSIADLQDSASPSLSLVSNKSGSVNCKPPISAFVAMSQANPSLEHYIVRFVGSECGMEMCRLQVSKEHFHCKQCKGRLFSKKEEMLRHYKWHRKREESLSHGFMRYSASDNCSLHFSHCPHNVRQTHYHCLQHGCDKVYISTSDVQMHANSHRKAAHIAREGFQRFKASERCNYHDCPFDDPLHRTTHFHCLRPHCTHSFKNKSDMDKHKAHHLKDEQLIRDGFKKFMKSETCSFRACPFSRVVNHIHCIRRGCEYVLHSTTQMYSHKRKHEKQDKRAVDLALAQSPAAFPSLPTKPAVASNPSPASNPFLNTAALAVMGASILRGETPNPLFPVQSLLAGGKSSLIGDFSSLSNASSEGAGGGTVGPAVGHQQKKFKIKHYDPSSQQFHSDSDSPGPNSGPTVDKSGGKIHSKSSSNQKALKKQENHPETTTNKPASLPIKIKQYDPSSKVFVHTETLGVLSNPSEIKPEIADSGYEAISDSGEDSQHALSDQQNKSDWNEMPENPEINLQLFQQPLNLLVPTLEPDEDGEPDEDAGNTSTPASVDKDKDGQDGLNSWKNYITRYTANDRCIPHCVLLYKDHYHCSSGDGCTVTFRNKEGVREHARQHKLLDSAAKHYQTSDKTCDKEGCTFSGNQTHYHCNWPSCKETIGATEPIFRRLEHFKVHEYQTQLQTGWNGTSSTYSNDDSKNNGDSRRKRGRPPKYQVMDVNVNPTQNVSMSPEVLFSSFKLPKGSGTSTPSRRGRPRTVSSPRQYGEASTEHLSKAVPDSGNFTLSQFMNILPKPSSPSVPEPQLKPQFEGFMTYMPSELCPDITCKYPFQMHFHCQAPRCFFATNKSDLLENHSRDFHESLEIPEGFACYDRGFNCKYPACPYVEKTRHFHCTQMSCTEAFIKVNALDAHQQQVHSSAEKDAAATMIDLFDDPMKLIKTAGTFFPTGTNQQAFQNLFFPLGGMQGLQALNALGSASASGSSSVSQQLNQQMPYTIEQHCGRPFCKLKRRIHFHCTTCYQGFSNASRLLPHLQKHGLTLPPQAAAAALISLSALTSTANSVSCISSTATSTPITSIAAMDSSPVNQPPPNCGDDEPQVKTEIEDQSPSSNMSASNTSEGKGGGNKKIRFHMFQPQLLKFTNDGRKLFSESQDSPANEPPSTNGKDGGKKSSGKGGKRAAKSADKKAGNPPIKQLKFVDCTQDAVDAVMAAARQEEPAPEGYARFNSRADCGLSVCVLKGTLHFHCLRPGCGFALSDKSQIQIHSDFHVNNFGGMGEGFAASVQANQQAMQRANFDMNSQKFDPVGGNSQGTASSAGQNGSQRKTHAQLALSMACKETSCEYQIKGTHYHCEKCPGFWSMDSTKYTLHMRQHAKQDQVVALGFEKVSPSVEKLCHFDSCGFTAQVHYHCLACKFICLNQLQMTMHKSQHDSN